MKLLTAFGLSAGIAFAAVSPSLAQDGDIENQLTLETSKGEIVIGLRPDLAPNHVQRIKELAQEGLYDRVVFHRVIDGFMAQTGDVQFGRMPEEPSEDAESATEEASTEALSMAGMGGSTKPDLDAEFSESETFDRGTVGMARAQDPNSANSQFFIMLADGDFLDGQYTIVGDVTEGMDVVDEIKKGDPQQNGSVEDPDMITRASVGSSEESSESDTENQG